MAIDRAGAGEAFMSFLDTRERHYGEEASLACILLTAFVKPEEEAEHGFIYWSLAHSQEPNPKSFANVLATGVALRTASGRGER